MVVWWDTRSCFNCILSVESCSVTECVVHFEGGSMRYWERRYILSGLCEIFCRYLFDTLDSQSMLVLLFLFRFCLEDMSIGKWEILWSSTINVQGLICNLSFSKLSFWMWMSLCVHMSLLEFRKPPWGGVSYVGWIHREILLKFDFIIVYLVIS